MKTRHLVLLVALGVPECLAAQDWTRFRGPSGQGIARAADLPSKFTEKNVRWRVAVGGKGHSSPVLVGHRLFLTREGDEDGMRSIVCFDARTGKELWAREREVVAYRQHRFNSFASSTPAVDAKAVHVVWSSGEDLIALALDHEGKLLWRRRLGAFRARHGSGSSPIVHDDLLIVANENEGDESFLMGLDKASGKTRWKIERESSARCGAYSCPVVFQPDKGTAALLFASQSHGLTAVDPRAGKVLWELNPGFKQRCVATPCISGDLVFLSAGSGGGGKECAFISIPGESDVAVAESSARPKVLRRLRRAIPYVPSAIAIERRFYLFTDGGIVTCMKAPTGKMLWKERLDGAFFSSPVSDGKTIFIPSREGTLFSVATGSDFEILGTFELGSSTFATPAIANGMLYARTSRHLICLGEED